MDDVPGSGSLRPSGASSAIGADVAWRGACIRNSMDGWIDKVRASGGVRYTGSSFRPQRRLAADGDTAALLHMGGAVGEYLCDSGGSTAHVKLREGASVRRFP